MIDTHCHIFLEQFNDDRSEVLKRAEEVGITDICMPAIQLDSLEKMNRIEFPGIALHKMAGIHPTEIESNLPNNLENRLMKLCEQEDIIAVGETGLDYYWSTKYIDIQKKSLHIHCRVAKATGKPVVLHNRDSTGDMLTLIEEEQDGSLTGIWHCFTGTVEEGKRAIDMGLKLGIGGVTTFKNAGVDRNVAQLPLSEMMLETDAPYLAPSPKRGKRNEPAFVKHTAKKLAQLFNITVQEIDRLTTKNARELFNI